MTNRTLNDVQINVGFNEANSRENIASGESLNTIFGKTKKWFSDLKAVAFTGNYSDLNNAPNIPVEMTGATSSSAGTSGLVPAPAKGAQLKFLRGDGTWEEIPKYILPTASTTVLGGVKVDNTTIKIKNGVISTVAGRVVAQSGSCSTSNNGNASVTFSTIYSSIPVVALYSSDSRCYINRGDISTSGFSCYNVMPQSDGMPIGYQASIRWYALGVV